MGPTCRNSVVETHGIAANASLNTASDWCLSSTACGQLLASQPAPCMRISWCDFTQRTAIQVKSRKGQLPVAMSACTAPPVVLRGAVLGLDWTLQPHFGGACAKETWVDGACCRQRRRRCRRNCGHGHGQGRPVRRCSVPHGRHVSVAHRSTDCVPLQVSDAAACMVDAGLRQVKHQLRPVCLLCPPR